MEKTPSTSLIEDLTQPFDFTEDQPVDEAHVTSYPTVKDVDGSIHSGFQLSTLVGPLCGEPVVGVAWVIEECKIEKPDSEGGEGKRQCGLGRNFIHAND